MIPLYTFVFLEWFTLFWTFDYISRPDTTLKHTIIATFALGQISGYGFLYSHELFHKQEFIPKTVGVLNMLKSLYLHFYSEHCLGHHKNVGTPTDPTTSKLNQSLYNFIGNTIPQSFMDSWKREIKILSKSGQTTWSINNRMIQWISIEIIFVLSI